MKEVNMETKTVPNMERILVDKLRTCADALKATTAQRDLLYTELNYIVGISTGQVQRVAQQALEKMK